MGSVLTLPGAGLHEQQPPDRPTLNLLPHEVSDAAGGYKRPADQLRELHARGFVRAWRRGESGRVILERAHYDAVTRGQFAAPAANQAAERPRAQPNRAGFLAKFGKKGQA